MPAPDVDRVERRFNVLGLVILAGRQVRCEGNGVAVTDQVDFGPKPAS